MRRKPSKRNNEKCFICSGEGRLKVRKDSGMPKNPYIFIEERCQICEGKGVINYDNS